MTRRPPGSQPGGLLVSGLEAFQFGEGDPMPENPLTARVQHALDAALRAAETPRSVDRSGSADALRELLATLTAAEAGQLAQATGLLSRLAWERHRAAKGWHPTGVGPDGWSSRLA